MPAIDLDYLVGNAAIDIFVMLAISVGIVAEMRCDNPRIERWRLSDGNRLVASGSKLISSRLKLANVG
jgi:hypothetical protein